MPFRQTEFTAKVQFLTSAETPSLIYKAVLATGKVSNTQYLQHVVAEALSRDLGLPLDTLLSHLPASRGNSNKQFTPRRGEVAGPTPTEHDVI